MTPDVWRRLIHVIARSEATKQSILPLRGAMDCFASLAMTTKHTSAFPRHLSPGPCKSFAHKEEGAGNAGCLLHPRSRVPKTIASAHEHTGTVGAFRRPCAMVLRLMPCSPRRRIRLVTVIGGLRFCRARLGSQHLRRFDTSNGCQDHTVLPYAATRLRQKASPGFGVVRLARDGRSRETRPAISFAPDAAASTASHPNVRDDGRRPSSGMRRRELCR
jgi:hypothetical protein